MLAQFLENLFDNGKVVFDAPQETAPDRAEAIGVLKSAFESFRLGIAGPPIDFDVAAALTAAEFLRWVTWFLVHRDSSAREVERCLVQPDPPRSAAQHLSADLTFRYLAQLHRRAIALSPDDVLTKRLTVVLRTFPLSGVLAQLDEAPTSPPDFDGHRGLELMYAERFAQLPRDSWRPVGRVAEFVELVQR